MFIIQYNIEYYLEYFKYTIEINVVYVAILKMVERMVYLKNPLLVLYVKCIRKDTLKI